MHGATIKTKEIYLYTINSQQLSHYQRVFQKVGHQNVTHDKAGNVLPSEQNMFATGLFLQPTLMHNSITTCMSHYYPRHVSGLDMPILRRNNCTNTASGILALLSGCTLHRLRGVQCTAAQKSEDTKCCVCAVVPPEDGHVKARNMSRIVI